MEKYRRLLLVDDDNIGNEINKAILTMAEFASEIVIKTSVNSALEFIENEKEGGVLPDLVFLDINMPERNGWDFISDYEKLTFSSERPYIVMLTSSLNPNDRERALSNASVVNFITKPISFDILNKLYGDLTT
jgi:CheY-like chemotaxis protein